jgi:hypothetical protein
VGVTAVALMVRVQKLTAPIVFASGGKVLLLSGVAIEFYLLVLESIEKDGLRQLIKAWQ